MFYDNLLTACERKGVKITPLVAECGGAKGSISNWKKGASPNSDIVLKLAVRLNVSTDYLLTGEEFYTTEMLLSDQQELIEDYKTLNDIDKARVLERVKTLKELSKVEENFKKSEALQEDTLQDNIKSEEQAFDNEIENNTDEEEIEDDYIYLDFPDLPVSAGTGVYLHDDYAEQIKVAINDETRRANYALKVKGDSMEPLFFDGDIVLVETQPSVKEGEIGIFIYDGEAYIKEFGGNRLISLNPKCPDKRITDFSNFYCKGLVIGALDKKDILK